MSVQALRVESMSVVSKSNIYHIKALVILVFIYVLPLILNALNICTEIYWHRHILISCLCIALLYLFVKINYKTLATIFMLEVTAMIATILASKMQWFNEQFELIMKTIFFTEIAIVIGGATFGPIFRDYDFGAPLRKLFKYVYNGSNGNNLGS